jgi:hypothetical protein
MFAAAGEEAELCRWTALLGGEASRAAPTRRGASTLDAPALAASFGVALMGGEAPLEVAGRAVLGAGQ